MLILFSHSSHLNKTTTFERPQRYGYDEAPPEPRTVVLQRSPAMGFGFVAGSEKPVIVRFVTEGGPSVGKVIIYILSSQVNKRNLKCHENLQSHSLSQVTIFSPLMVKMSKTHLEIMLFN